MWLIPTSGLPPALQAPEGVDVSGAPLSPIAQHQAPYGRYSMRNYPDAGTNDTSGPSPDTCITAELPVLSGAGQIFDASGKPAGSDGK
mgnify:CR=1 FL=1